MRDEIARAQDGISRITGSTPRFFRAPAGLRNPFLDPILESLALRLASWTRRGFDTINGDADVVYRRLARSLGGGDILLMHDGNAAHSATGGPVILEVLPKYQADLSGLSRLYLPGTNGAMVPLSAVTTLTRSAMAQPINHAGQVPAITVSFDGADDCCRRTLTTAPTGPLSLALHRTRWRHFHPRRHC
jgi:hypothetical protein